MEYEFRALLRSHQTECGPCSRGTYWNDSSDLCPVLKYKKEKLWEGMSEWERTTSAYNILRDIFRCSLASPRLGPMIEFDIVKLLIADAQKLWLGKRKCGDLLFDKVAALLSGRDNTNLTQLDLELDGHDDQQRISDTLFSSLSHLQDMRLKNPSLTDSLFKTISTCCPQLQSISIDGADIEDVPEDGLGPLLRELASLKHVEYNWSKMQLVWRGQYEADGVHYEEEFEWNIYDASQSDISSFFPDELKTNINRVHFRDPQYGVMDLAFQKFQNLQSLELSIWDGRIFSELLDQRSEALRGVFLYITNSSEFRMQVSDLLTSFPGLTNLVVSSNEPLEKCSLRPTAALRTLLSLEVPNTEDNPIDLHALFEAAPKLSILRIGHTDVTSQQLDQQLKGNPDLREFSAVAAPKLSEWQRNAIVDKYDKVKRIGDYRGAFHKTEEIPKRRLISVSNATKPHSSRQKCSCCAEMEMRLNELVRRIEEMESGNRSNVDSL